MITEKLIILPILIPLFTGLINTIIPNKFFGWFLSFCSIFLNIIIISYLIYFTRNGSILSYVIGNWDKKYGIEFTLNSISSFLILVISLVSFIIIVYLKNYLNSLFINDKKFSYFLSCMMFCYTGLSGIIITNDIFNLYVFLEITSLSSYALLSINDSKKSLHDVFSYLIIGTIASTLYLFGIGMIYAANGSLNITTMMLNIMNGLSNNKLIMFGIILTVIAMFIKVAVFPFSFWIIRAYSNSHNIVTTFLAGSSTKVMSFIILKICLLVNYAFGTLIISKYISTIIIIISFISIIIGLIYAILSNRLKHILIYSSIAQTGYILLAITSIIRLENNNLFYSIAAVLFMIANDSIVKTSIFICEDIISNIVGDIDLKNIQKFNFLIPNFLKGLIYIMILSIAGLPLTTGFIGKLYLISIFSSNLFALIIISICTALSIIYCMKITYYFYIKSDQIIDPKQYLEKNKQDNTYTISYSTTISLLVAVFISISFGTVFANQIAGIIHHSLNNYPFVSKI